MKVITAKALRFYGFGGYVSKSSGHADPELLKYTVCFQFWGWTVWFTW